MIPTFIDSHAHLNDPAFDADRDAILTKQLPQAGVSHSIEIGCSPDEWEPALSLSRNYPHQVRAVLGVHPEYSPLYSPQEASRLAPLLQQKEVVALGEIGLDYTCLDIAPREQQHAVFDELLTLANQTALPLVLHVRRQAEDYAVYEDVFAALAHRWNRQSRTQHAGVLHCFCARYEEAKKALDNGLLLGINGCFTYKKNEYIREAVKKAGLHHLVLETDCPYLSPQGKRGQRNDPSNIPLIAQYLADYLDLPLEEVARTTTQRAKELYALL